MLFDADSFVELDGFVMTGDEPAGVVCGYGCNGKPACAFAQDGSGFGRAQATKIASSMIWLLKPVFRWWAFTTAPEHGWRRSRRAGGYSELLRINNLSGVVPQISLVAGPAQGLLPCWPAARFLVMTKDAQFFMALRLQDKVEGGHREAAAKRLPIVADTDARLSMRSNRR